MSSFPERIMFIRVMMMRESTLEGAGAERWTKQDGLMRQICNFGYFEVDNKNLPPGSAIQ